MVAKNNDYLVEEPTKKLLQTKAQVRESLAKLMAIENISVRHENVTTAGFDIQNRSLILPVFDLNMSDDLYTMLITHEVGHALHTPSAGWSKIMRDPIMRHIVNVVEDCRIEKLMIKKFPGTRPSFSKATQEMLDKDIFGLDSGTQKIEDYGLIDRLNLYFKPGRYVGMDIPLSKKDMYWVNEVDGCKTFEDVLKVSRKLHSYIEENEDDTIDSKQNQNQSNTKGGTEDPNSTQKAMDAHIKRFIDLNATNIEHLNIPKKIDLSDIVIPYKEVHNQIRSKWYKNNPRPLIDSQLKYCNSNSYEGELELAEESYSSFLKKNKRIINNLVNMFHQRKSAKTHSRSKVACTGRIDTNSLHSYKFNDDIFKKIRTVPKGKSHGMVMFLDLSGSMYNNMYGSIEQMMNLVMFCRKINIPFEVYGFTDNYKKKSSNKKLDNLQEDDIVLGDLHRRFNLRQYFTNKMKATEFKDACINMFAIANGHIRKSLCKDNNLHCTLPPQEKLGGTPLDSTIIASIQLVKDMKKKYSLDKMNAIFITDGESSHGLIKKTSNNSTSSAQLDGKIYVTYDRKANKSWNLSDADNSYSNKRSYNKLTNHWISIMKQITGATTIGFYLSPNSYIARYLEGRLHKDKPISKNEALNLIKKNGFIESKEHGYDAYYYIEDGTNLNTSDDPDIQELLENIADSDKTKNEIKRNMQAAVNNEMKNKRKKRVLLSRFIDIIA